MLITIDTLNFAVPDLDEKQVIELLKIDPGIFEIGSRPEMNYQYAIYYQGIKISFGGKGRYKSYVNLSGKGCRTFEDLRGESFDWETFMIEICNGADIDFRRIDIAVDEYEGVLNVRRCAKYYEDRKIAGACRTYKYTLGSEEIFYAGSTQSTALLRIYNKALERGYDDGLVDGHPWVRAEFQLRDRAAAQVICEWLQSHDLMSVYRGHVLEHVRFLSQVNNGHSDRLSLCSWWKKFTGNVQRIKFVSKPGSDYNLHRCQRFLYNQAASSIKAYALAKNLTPDELYNEFTRMNISLNDDQKVMVKQLRGEDFLPDDTPVVDLPYDPWKPQNLEDLINHILKEDIG